MPSICTINILHLFGLVLFNSTHTENNGKGGMGKEHHLDTTKIQL